MLRFLILATLIATPVFAQEHTEGMDHSSHMTGMSAQDIIQSGQSTFAAIEEIVQVLEVNPNTDWSKVDIASLREHLRDMDLVFTMSEVTTEPTANGLLFTVSGEDRVRDAIRNMTLTHASVMDGVDGWRYVAEEYEDGATLTITVPPFELARLNALGFFGIMATGMHHQDHHWMMATGGSPHQ